MPIFISFSKLLHLSSLEANTTKANISYISLNLSAMDAYHYEEVLLSNMLVEDGKLIYPCPCGDLFELSLQDFAAGADVAQCPTCSLTIKVKFTHEEKAHLLHSEGTSVLIASSV
ncbi:unnamed protein product [Phytomonas sp. EM1]|nr:unnamed protein product [Phytomonas sp. EM1]|eukprot:CCW65036.1 unnamed protein product [Phytomonas sp. isolate EM1]